MLLHMLQTNIRDDPRVGRGYNSCGASITLALKATGPSHFDLILMLRQRDPAGLSLATNAGFTLVQQAGKRHRPAILRTELQASTLAHPAAASELVRPDTAPGTDTCTNGACALLIAFSQGCARTAAGTGCLLEPQNYGTCTAAATKD
jgi:hypothetical protein